MLDLHGLHRRIERKYISQRLKADSARRFHRSPSCGRRVLRVTSPGLNRGCLSHGRRDAGAESNEQSSGRIGSARRADTLACNDDTLTCCAGDLIGGGGDLIGSGGRRREHARTNQRGKERERDQGLKSPLRPGSVGCPRHGQSVLQCRGAGALRPRLPCCS